MSFLPQVSVSWGRSAYNNYVTTFNKSIKGNPDNYGDDNANRSAGIQFENFFPGLHSSREGSYFLHSVNNDIYS